MLIPVLITVYCLLFTLITYYRFHLGLFFLFLLLPTYLIRFNIGPLPTTLLEVMVWIVLIVWLIKYHKSLILKLKTLILKHKTLLISSLLFLTAATISIFTSVDLRAAAGEWKAFYIEPFLIFLVLITTINNKESTIRKILFALILSGLATSLLAIIQHFTGWMVPWDFWENANSYRVTGWYGFPNAVGLFLAPIVPLALYLLIQGFQRLQNNWPLVIISFLFLISSIPAIIFAKSTGALIGVITGIGLLLLFYKKTRWPAIVLGIIALASIFSFSSLSGIKQELTLQDRSGQIRIAMWGEATEFLFDHPVLGAGLASYKDAIVPYHTTVNGEGVEIFHHPHNLFLTMWVNLGLLGLVGFIGIIIWFYTVGLSRMKLVITSAFVLPFLLSSMTIIIITGLVDSPYIKNDLAILFWLLPALLIISTKKTKKTV